MSTKKRKTHSGKDKKHKALFIYAGAAAAVALCVFAVVEIILPRAMSLSYEELPAAASTSPSSAASPAPDAVPSVAHVATPAQVRAIYMSQCVVGTPSFRSSLEKFIDGTSLNSVVIDIKDYSGGIGFPAEGALLKPFAMPGCGARDMKDYVAKLHEKGVYVIGRITVFQDPLYAKAHPELAVQRVGGGVWKNYGGLAFVDVGAKPFWDYIVELSRESYALGFDELNYDYIRFPSDGPMKEAVYSLDEGKTKAQALEEFFKYLHEQVSPLGVVMSADLFGYVTVHTDDLGIGQILERALPYFDYIDPMVYPSHYNKGFAGLDNVNSDPYKVVHVSLVEAVARTEATTTSIEGFTHTPIMTTVVSPGTAGTPTTTKQVPSGYYTKTAYPKEKIRPWLQSFDYPVAYTPAMVSAQIRATEDTGLHAWIFWDAANKYTSLRSVLAQSLTEAQ